MTRLATSSGQGKRGRTARWWARPCSPSHRAWQDRTTRTAEPGYSGHMTSDLDATTDDLHRTIRDLWRAAQHGTTDDLAPPGRDGQAVASVPDTLIADETGLELTVVREFLDNADGVKLVVGRDGDSRSVTALLAD